MVVAHEYLPATDAAQQELVLLHGWGSNREVWRPLLVLLRPWANVTLLDLPGCEPGRVSGARPELAALLAGILDCCPPQAVYIGWSLGGQLALELAAYAPQRVIAVVTVCSTPRFVATAGWPGMDEQVFREFCSAVQADPIAAVQRFDTLQVTGSHRPRELLRQLPLLPHLPAGTELLTGLHLLQTLDQREMLRLLPQPHLHLLATRDALVPAAVAAALEACIAGVRSAHVKVLHDICHLAPLDAPKLLASEIRDFLDNEGKLYGKSVLPAPLDKRVVAASFSRAAAEYDTVAHLQRAVGLELLTHLDACTASPTTAPTTILDLGCGTGYFHAQLKARFPGALYLGLDLAVGMVGYAREHCSGESAWLVADAEALPLASESVDLVFSSLALQWCARPEHLFAELARVLRPGGCCVFTTLGPDTLRELRSAWAAVDSHQHVNAFLPVTALSAAAERVHGIELTLQQQNLCMEYPRVRDLLDELRALGAHNMNRSRPPGLTSRLALQGMLQAYEAWRREGVLPASYDVIFGRVKKA